MMPSTAPPIAALHARLRVVRPAILRAPKKEFAVGQGSFRLAEAKETACRHDGYVFCIPERNRKLLAAIKRIVPTAENYAHQRCSETEILFLVPMQQDEVGFCVERGGAMTDKAWNQVCSLARRREIAGIKPVHFE